MTSYARYCCAWLLLVLPPTLCAQGKDKSPAPWDGKRRAGIVRVELSLEKQPLIIGTGAIVRGYSDEYYVITATHNVAKLPTETKPSADHCADVPDGLRLRRGNAGGPELRAKCVYHLRSDISVIQLYSPDEHYPTIMLVPRPVKRGMSVYIAGFPGGVLDYSRFGPVTSTEGEDGTAIANFTTMSGFSGAPYAAEDGAVIGFHRGGPRFASGFPHFVPVWRIQHDLERVLGPLDRLQVREPPMPTPPKPPSPIDIIVTP